MKKEQLPQDGVPAEKMQGHWVMTRLGKKVLRPGGMVLTRRMMQDLQIQSSDSVIEFAPGMGATARLTLRKNPKKYTAVDYESAIVKRIKTLLNGTSYTCIQGLAQKSGLPSGSATKVYSEAILTMQTDSKKKEIVKEAYRLLGSGGLYGIHEVGIIDTSNKSEIKEIQSDLTHSIKVDARPLLNGKWRELIENEGFEIVSEHRVPFHLLNVQQIFVDEGFFGALKFFWNMIRLPRERNALLSMKRVFKKFDNQICAIALVARKK